MKKQDIILTIISIILSAMLLYAMFFVKPKFNVSFEVDNKIINDIKVEEGKNFKKPADPVKENYTFIGWFIGEEEYNFASKVKKDLTLTAKFEETKNEEEKTTKKKSNKR